MPKAPTPARGRQPVNSALGAATLPRAEARPRSRRSAGKLRRRDGGRGGSVGEPWVPPRSLEVEQIEEVAQGGESVAGRSGSPAGVVVTARRCRLVERMVPRRERRQAPKTLDELQRR